MIPALDLDHTLGCGQVFRWRKEGGDWKGMVGDRHVVLRQSGPRVEVLRGMGEGDFRSYFRCDDDLDRLRDDLAGDGALSGYLDAFPGLRLVRQGPWECLASYVLATNANIPRIQGMIERVCRTFGSEVGEGLFAFPTPGQILDGCQSAGGCGLGYRAGRFVELARMACREEFDLQAMRDMEYEDCVRELVRLPGVGRKVADCVALFSLDHLEAFPVDVRVKRAMEELYGMRGSAVKVGEMARERFGEWAGYAQEYIYYGYGRRVTGTGGTRSPGP